MKSWRKAGAGLLIVMAGWGAVRAAGRVFSVLDLMNALTRRHNDAEEFLFKGKTDRPLADDLREMDRSFEILAGSYEPFYGGDPSDWRGFCDDSRAALRATEDALSAGDAGGARTAFLRLAEFREKAHDQFQPGLFKKFSRFFKKKDHRKETLP